MGGHTWMKTIVTATSSITIKVEILFHIGFNVMGLHQRNREGEGVFFFTVLNS